MNRRRLVPGGDGWPSHLSHPGLEPTPRCLYAEGDALPPREQCIAIVGTRRPTTSGIEIASRFARAFAESDLVVVSGLAIGIDSVAHRAALGAGGFTIAVLGCGLDVCYPKRNATLRREIPARGTVVTEYEDGTAPHKQNFPARNRIIAGLASAVVVVEGGPQSGALITAGYAADAGRDVFAVPGSPLNAASSGPNELIRKGATLVTEPRQVFEDLAPQLVWRDAYSPGDRGPELSEAEGRVLTALDAVPATMDRIAKAVDRPEGEVSLCLAKLQLRGLARRARTGGFEITEAGGRRAGRLPV